MSYREHVRPRIRRATRALAWLVLVAWSLVAHPDSAPLRAHARRDPGRLRAPNLLILVGDDHAGGTLGVDGDPRKATPRIDALARGGVRFDRAYCNSPLCTPSRQSFITGRLPHAVGVTRLNTPMPESAVTLGDWLGDRGYDTAAIGKMHFNDRNKHGFDLKVDEADWHRWLDRRGPSGFDHQPRWRPFRDPARAWLNADGHPAGLPESKMEATYFADRAAEFLRGHRDRGRSAPFALVVGFNEPHAPFRFPDGWAGRRSPGEFATPPVSEADRVDRPQVFEGLTSGDVRGIQAAYYSSLFYLDHEVGRVLDALDASGLADDTIVVYLGDNGYLLGQHGRFEKYCFFEPAVRVPLILRWPGHLPEGREVRDLVELVDLLPTLLELAGQPEPPGLHGRSLAGLARGEPGAKGHEVVVGEYLENEEAMARSSRYKLVVGTGARKRVDGYHARRGPRGPTERLYDLEADPGETTDLTGRLDLVPVANDLRRALLDRLRSTRVELDPIPPGLTDAEALRRCLVPRD